MTDKEFCKIYSSYYGEVIDKVGQLTYSSFNGEELKSQNKKGKSQRINDIYFGEVEVYFDQYEKEIYIARHLWDSCSNASSWLLPIPRS